MQGPKAPKDPTAKGSSFYICRQKDIAGNPTPDGKGIQFIYLDGVRLISLAKMVGNIEDEAMLENLKTAEGFLNMVAGIGVTVDAASTRTNVNFEFQMYGKTDPYHSGDTIKVSVKPDGMEQIIWLDDYTWCDDNDIVGQMRYVFENPGDVAVTDVKLYLREGFEAPEQEEANPVDVNSEDYRLILTKSLKNTGNYARLKRVIDRSKAGEEVTVAFIGGSITQGAGAIPIHEKSYAFQTYDKWKKAFGENTKFIKAGVGGTSSEFGIVRFERDVLREGTVKPDLVVIEFAVNDAGDETGGVCYESLIRKCLSLSEFTAVVLLFAVFVDDWNLEDRLGPIGERYNLPMVSIKMGVVDQFYKKPGEGRVLSKSQFFYDSYHPTNMGHYIMSDCLMNLFREVDKLPEKDEEDWKAVAPYMGDDFTFVRLADKHTNADKLQIVSLGSFSETDEELQYAEKDVDPFGTKQFPYNWHRTTGNEPFVMKITCKALLIVTKDSGEVTYGKAKAVVDGKEVRVMDPKEVGWTHCNSQILLNERESGEHVVEISMLPEDAEKKFTILGFGYVE